MLARGILGRRKPRPKPAAAQALAPPLVTTGRRRSSASAHAEHLAQDRTAYLDTVISETLELARRAEEAETIVLSQDPVIRVMMDDSAAVNYEDVLEAEGDGRRGSKSRAIRLSFRRKQKETPQQPAQPPHDQQQQPQPQQPLSAQQLAKSQQKPKTSSASVESAAKAASVASTSSAWLPALPTWLPRLRQRLCLVARSLPCLFYTKRRKKTSFSCASSTAKMRSGSTNVVVVVNGGADTGSVAMDEDDLYEDVACAPFRSEGRVTSACLWHSCRAVTLGVILIIMGIVMAILGFLDDQVGTDERPVHRNVTGVLRNVEPGMATEDRFKLNNLSFAGPVVMGVGGFLIVAACVMTFEARDNAAKVVPSAALAHQQHEERAKLKFATIEQIVTHYRRTAIKFRHSSSQTTFLDRNIVETLNVTETGVGACVNAASMVGVGAAASIVGTAVASSSTNKRASFDGKLPEACDLEPGLALMDEIGRRALTNAFIHFTRNTSIHVFRDSLVYDLDDADSALDGGDGGDDDDVELGGSSRRLSHSQMAGAHALPKCPSAPNIAHHKLDPNVVLPQISEESRQQQQQLQLSLNVARKSPSPSKYGAASASASTAARRDMSDGASSNVCGQYRVLTPTMYRSRMAATRQAVSMEHESNAAARMRREGPALRVPSPFQRPMRPIANDSLDLELGASATGVHIMQQAKARARELEIEEVDDNRHDEDNAALKSSSSSRNKRRQGSVHSESSLVLDLHVEGAGAITLLVRDSSRSTRSTSGNRETTTTTTTTSITAPTRSWSRSPSPANFNPTTDSPPSLLEQMSVEYEVETASGAAQSAEVASPESSASRDHNGSSEHQSRIKAKRMSFRQTGRSKRKQRPAASVVEAEDETGHADEAIITVDLVEEKRSWHTSKDSSVSTGAIPKRRQAPPPQRLQPPASRRPPAVVTSRSEEVPASPSPFGHSLKRLSRSLAEEMASLEFIDDGTATSGSPTLVTAHPIPHEDSSDVTLKAGESVDSAEEIEEAAAKPDDDNAQAQKVDEEEEAFLEIADDRLDFSEAFPMVPEWSTSSSSSSAPAETMLVPSCSTFSFPPASYTFPTLSMTMPRKGFDDDFLDLNLVPAPKSFSDDYDDGDEADMDEIDCAVTAFGGRCDLEQEEASDEDNTVLSKGDSKTIMF